VSLLVNAEMYTHALQPVAAFPAAEIVGHGRTNSERQGTLSEGDECGLIAETTAATRHASARLARTLDFTVAGHARFAAGSSLQLSARLVPRRSAGLAEHAPKPDPVGPHPQ
jgi:hypothetical protein